ncbi:MAG TPA: iron-sulfur cluster assembly protein [bacterium]|nr:iron-sulfur cluster assembly protein [bacterium]
MAVTKEVVMEALGTVNDPEIPGLSIVDLGLIYGVDVEGGKVDVRMTVTAPGCPMAHYMAQMAKKAVEQLEGVDEANVEVVFEPSWNPEMMSAEAKKRLGFE